MKEQQTIFDQCELLGWLGILMSNYESFGADKQLFLMDNSRNATNFEFWILLEYYFVKILASYHVRLMKKSYN